MCKEGWRFGLGHEGGCLREDGGGGGGGGGGGLFEIPERGVE